MLLKVSFLKLASVKISIKYSLSGIIYYEVRYKINEIEYSNITTFQSIRTKFNEATVYGLQSGTEYIFEIAAFGRDNNPGNTSDSITATTGLLKNLQSEKY